MEAAGSYTNSSSKDDRHDHDDEDVPLPGFRFHPTDEELVGFYLRRKIQNKPISLELIKSIDIYKHDPWDLPKAMSTAGADKEWYFFCRRGRKYKNSIRPNRVTGSGFWKATGIDKPVHDSRNINCIGLKKTLVYYRGSAGKGTKTDWMMHEFRLPLVNDANNVHTNRTSCTAQSVNNTDPPEAEIWTLCRIFKRNVSHRKYTSDWRELSTKHSKKCGTTNFHQDRKYLDSPANQEANYIDFGASAICYEEKKPQVIDYTNYSNNGISNNIQSMVLQNNVGQLSSNGMATNTTHPYTMESFSSNFDIDSHVDFFNEDWDEIRSVVQLALDPTFF